jgi:hypothetical protein
LGISEYPLITLQGRRLLSPNPVVKKRPALVENLLTYTAWSHRHSSGIGQNCPHCTFQDPKKAKRAP